MNNVIETRWITLQNGMQAYLALPPSGQGPGLLLFQEIFGVNAHIQTVARQYALAGFVVLAPDLFWRDAPRIELGYEGEERQRALALMSAYGPEAALADIANGVQALRSLPEVGAARVGALGYCLGGRMAYLAAATTAIDAAVAYYGGGIHKQLERAADIRCPMQFHFAGQDDGIPPEAVAAIEAAMQTSVLGSGQASGHASAYASAQTPARTGLAPAQVHRYPGSHHGFNCWARPAYHGPSASLALGRSIEFLARTLF